MGKEKSPYYYHGIVRDEKRSEMEKVISILQDEKIKTKSHLGYTQNFGYNGMDYISICKKLPYKETRELVSAYQFYIPNHFCFILKDCLKVVPTTMITLDNTYEAYYEFYQRSLKYPFERYSEFFDEYQVLGDIPLTYGIALGIPFCNLDKILVTKESLEQFKRIIIRAHQLGLDIVDTSFSFSLNHYRKRKRQQGYQKIYSVWNRQNKKIIG